MNPGFGLEGNHQLDGSGSFPEETPLAERVHESPLCSTKKLEDPSGIQNHRRSIQNSEDSQGCTRREVLARNRSLDFPQKLGTGQATNKSPQLNTSCEVGH